MQLDFAEQEKPKVRGWISEHQHTVYSLLDGMCKIKPLVTRAKELGMKAIAITDHGHSGGCMVFQKECKKQGIKPMLGAELYYTPDMETAALPVEERDALAIYSVLQDNEARAAADWELADRKKDIKTVEEYDALVRSSEKNEHLAVLDVFTKKEIAAFKRKNAKLFEAHAYSMKQYHLILIAMNTKGWQNLCAIQSIASRDCQYNGRALCDLSLLKKYNEGLLVTTACVGSLFSHLVQQRRLDEAERELLDFKEVFGDRFYLEIQPLTLPQQIVTNAFYFDMHKKHGIPVIATSDVHYIYKEDWDDHDTYLCISTGKLKDDEKNKALYIKTHKKDPEGKGWKPRMKYTNDYWLRTPEEMVDGFLAQVDASRAIFKNEPDPLATEEYQRFYVGAINNTLDFADRVDEDVLIGSAETLYPKVKNVPKGFTSDEWLMAEAVDGLVKYQKKMEAAGTPIDFDVYKNRILDEMAVITTKHYSDYFLGVQEYINWANSINPETGFPYCVTGPGRGSAAASLVLFLIGVTHNIDPIKYNLMFSRFLTMDRNEPPDVDCDFSNKHRPLIIHHLEDVYGKDHVCHIGTWSTESIYTGIKDFSRVLDVPLYVVDKINKKLQALSNNDPKACFQLFDDMETKNPAGYKEFKALEEENKEVFRLARKFEGSIRQWGSHASGIIACPVSLIGLVPTRYDKEKGETAALFTGVELEEANCIKYDILGLKNLDVLESTLTALGKDFSWLYEHVKMDDKKAFRMICSGKTEGMFQIESNMMKGLIKNIQPDNIEDLAALVAIGRPGPLSIGVDRNFADWKKDPSLKQEFLPNIDDFLERSYGCIVYQEQLMQISMRVCGFDQGQSDSIMRKILGKKKVAMLPMLRRCMIWGKVNHEGPEGWDEEEHQNDPEPWYDPTGHYGAPICGAVAKGYTVEQVDKFFHDIQGFASYCFNLGHSLSYGYIALLTAFMKSHYPAPYMAAVLSILGDTDEKKEKYMKAAEDMNLSITVPDVNRSKDDFTAVDDHTIAYGLASIKGVKDVTEIIANAPYESVTDAVTRLSSKAFNKRIAEGLIKAGAFDFEDTNRKKLLNEFTAARNQTKTKSQQEALIEDLAWDKTDCMQMEAETLGRSITYTPAWKGAMPGECLKGNCTFKSVKKHITKTSKKPMAMLTVTNEAYDMEALVFPREYPKYMTILENYSGGTYYVEGTMDKEGKKLIINKIEPPKAEGEDSPQADTGAMPSIDFSMFEF